MATEKENNFTFALSLSVLNHLGRHLYRSFVTVLGEAISNSWDADAATVRIYISRDKNEFVIIDDGTGMTEDDFQNKFLNIGYSKRKASGAKSPKGRPFIGRKGIGKLALLSCADQVTIASKTKGGEFVGGVINNADLDKAIDDALQPKDYPLGPLNMDLIKPYLSGKEESGTIIHFQSVKGGIKNTLELIKKIVALYFRFSLLDDSFKIFIGDEQITHENLKPLAEKTEFLWKINDAKDPYVDTQLPHMLETSNIAVEGNMHGFIASVSHYKDLNIMNLDERVGIDLFVNGRIRERDILKHITKSRLVESYLYGQIHFNDLDTGDNEDKFTSSREGIIPDDEVYQAFLKKLEDEVLAVVIKDWDKWRRKHRKDGDADNSDITLKERKSEELFNVVSKDYELPRGAENKGLVDGWIAELSADASFNLGSYAECFVSENLLRKHIVNSALTPTACTNIDPAGQTCIARHAATGANSFCEYCKGQRGMQSFQQQKTDAGIAIQVRTEEDNLLMYLDYIDLAKITDNTVLRDEDKPYKPLRNSVMHTSRLTGEAKTRLTAIFDNILAVVRRLLGGR